MSEEVSLKYQGQPASYGWKESEEPSIFVPAKWNPQRLPFAASQDRNGKSAPAKINTKTRPLESWRIDIDIEENTVFFSRWEFCGVKVLLYGLWGAANGHGFENAFRSYEQGLKESSSSHARSLVAASRWQRQDHTSRSFRRYLSFVETKTRNFITGTRINLKYILPKLWLANTQTLHAGYHVNGVFSEPIEEHDLLPRRTLRDALAIRDPAIQIPRWFEEFRPCKHWKTGQLFATIADQEPNFISGRAANGTHIRQCRFCLTEILVAVDEQALPKDSRVSASVCKDLGKVVSPSARNWPGHFEGNELPRSVAVRLGSIMGMLGGSAKYS
ncbi:geranylgeranyl pyrophosphate synthetase [Marssonina coronariae]|uniref:Geranylgeranyl pyrophosphate synthetase n=1 Tax=Diplocarpon coronariae TaxID=2795749 RepID=A0A218YZ18_9HELO|nr:geranylgeranyl pyrophosphate synthetase [Marssonina coronariae]